MEIKKSDKADLEKRRGEFFLLGLILTLAVFFVALEWTSRPSAASDDDSLLDDMAEDMDLLPAMDTHDMIAATSPGVPPKGITSKVKETSVADNTQEISSVTSSLVIGNGEGLEKDAKVDEAVPQTALAQTDTVVLRTVEQLPEFPGGMVAFMKWLTRNLKYPPMAQQQRIQGKVVVTFIINKDGSIASPQVATSVDPSLDREALRVVRMMPKWKPGMMDGKVCRTMFAIPINFQL